MDIEVGHERIDIGELPGPPAGSQREIHAGRAAGSRLLWQVEIRVTVDEHEPVRAKSSERQGRTEEYAAVSPNHERKSAALQA